MSTRILGDWIDSYMEYVRETEPPDCYKEWVAVGTLAACLQRRVFTNIWEERIYPNMYIVLVGPPAARKGTAMGPGVSLLREMDISLAPSVSTKEALLLKLLSSRVEENGVESYPLTAFSEELTNLLGFRDVEFISWLTEWFDCKLFDKETKGCGSTYIETPCFNLVGATTAEYLKSAVPTDAVGGGLFSRFLFVFAEKKGHSNPFPTQTARERQLRGQLLHDLHVIRTLAGEVKFTKGAVGLYIDWYTENDKNPPEMDRNLLGYVGRRAVHLRKLLISLTASRSNDLIITEKDFYRGVEMLERTESQMNRVFAGRGRLDTAEIMEDIMRLILLRKVNGVGEKELLYRFRFDLSPKELDEIMATLLKMTYKGSPFCHSKIEDGQKFFYLTPREEDQSSSS